MRVRWNKRALTQLRAAHGWIKKENPIAAEEFVEAVTALVDLLGEFPGMGVRTDEPGVAMFPLEGREVRIIRVRHASRRRLT
jgi:plasmid stabilization system protein ParE